MMQDPQRDMRLWIKAKLKAAGRGAKGKLAAHLKVRPDAITRMLNTENDKETRQISAHEILAIQDFFGTSIHEFQAAATVVVPVVAWVSAGALSNEHYVDEVIRRETIASLGPGDWIAFIVEGDSMDRISPPDSIIVVNRAEKRLVANACYVVGDLEGNSTYKRYRPSPPRFEPVSTNPAHEPIFPENDPVIVGRVRMSLLKM